MSLADRSAHLLGVEIAGPSRLLCRATGETYPHGKRCNLQPGHGEASSFF